MNISLILKVAFWSLVTVLGAVVVDVLLGLFLGFSVLDNTGTFLRSLFDLNVSSNFLNF